MFKVCGIIGVSKIEFFKVSGIEMVTQNQKKKKQKKKKENEKLKNHSKPSKLVRKSLFCFFFIENLFLSLPVTHSAGHNTILPSNSSISKMLKVNIIFTGHLLKSP